VAGGVAASGGGGYLPASANNGPTVGPTVINSASGYSVDPKTASSNQPTDSAAAGGAGPSPQQYGSVIASGIGAIGKALMPVSISNTAASKIDATRLPRAPIATIPAMTGR
jgi:hypothetical protein